MNPDDELPDSETSGNANIDELIDESIAAQDGAEVETPTPANVETAETAPVEDGDHTKGGNVTQQEPTGQQGRGATDLIDPATGQVVARGGAERRMYERDAPSRLMATSRELTAAQAQIQTHEAASASAKENNLTPEESITAHKLLGAYKNDPIETIKYLLTQAQAAGHNINAVGQGTDMAAISKMITDKLAPLTEQQQRVDEQQGHREAAQQEATQFLQRFPDAALHEQEIALLLQQRADLTPETAYYMLQNWFMRSGLDWNKPANAQDKPEGGDPTGGKVTLPSGRVSSAETLTTVDNGKSVDANTEWDDIVSGAIRSNNAA